MRIIIEIDGAQSSVKTDTPREAAALPANAAPAGPAGQESSSASAETQAATSTADARDAGRAPSFPGPQAGAPLDSLAQTSMSAEQPAAASTDSFAGAAPGAPMAAENFQVVQVEGEDAGSAGGAAS